MITYQQYMDKATSKVSEERISAHEEYYGQFVTSGIRQMVQSRFGADALKLALNADRWFNNIPIQHWDKLAASLPHSALHTKIREVGGCLTLSVQVCILKEAARQIVSQN